MRADRILIRMTFAMATAALGIAITKIALPTLAGLLGYSAAQIGLIAGSAAFAWPAFGLLAGWSLDRFGRAPAFRLGACLAATAAMCLFIAFRAEQHGLALLCLFALFIGIAEVLTETAGQTILPNLVEKDRLEKGNSWLQGGKTIAAMLLAPFLLATVLDFRPLWSFGVAFALAIAALFALPRPIYETNGAKAKAQDFFAGLHLLARETPHRRFTVLLTLMTLSWGAWMTLIVPYSLSVDHLNLGASGVGQIMMALGCGSVVGAMGYQRIKQHLGARGTLAIDLIASTVFLLVPGLSFGLLPVIGSAFMAGVGGVTWAIFVSAQQQATIPGKTLGRAVAAYRWIGWTGFFFGSTLSGAAADAFGLNIAFFLFALPSLMGIAYFCVRSPIAGLDFLAADRSV